MPVPRSQLKPLPTKPYRQQLEIAQYVFGKLCDEHLEGRITADGEKTLIRVHATLVAYLAREVRPTEVQIRTQLHKAVARVYRDFAAGIIATPDECKAELWRAWGGSGADINQEVVGALYVTKDEISAPPNNGPEETAARTVANLLELSPRTMWHARAKAKKLR